MVAYAEALKEAGIAITSEEKYRILTEAKEIVDGVNEDLDDAELAEIASLIDAYRLGYAD